MRPILWRVQAQADRPFRAACAGRDDTQNATIQNWLAQAKADGFDLFLDDSIVFGEGKSWKEMTVVEFENLEDTLRQIITVEINRREFTDRSFYI